MSKKSRVFVDGALIGLVDDPKALVSPSGPCAAREPSQLK